MLLAEKNPAPQEAGAKTTAAVVGTNKSVLARMLARTWTWGFLLGLVIFFSLTSPHFLDLFNFQAMGANAAILLVLALGQTFVIITGGIDLSVGYVMGFATIVGSMVMRDLIGSSLPIVVGAGLLAAVATGVVFGLLNGVLVAKLRISPFIATLGTLGIAQGLAYVISGGPPVSIPIAGLGAIGNGYLVYSHPTFGFSVFSPPSGVTGAEVRRMVGYIPFQVLYAGILTAVCAWLLSRSKFGRHVYAIGGNARASLRAGIPVNRRLFQTYVLSSLMAALAGFMYVLRYTGGVANAGDALLLASISTIVIGGASLSGGEGRILGTLVGAMIIAVLQNGLVLYGVDPFWQYVAVGVMIIGAVLVDKAKHGLVWP